MAWDGRDLKDHQAPSPVPSHVTSAPGFGCKCGMRVPFLQAILSWFNGGGLRSAAFSLPSLFLFLFQVGFFPGECVELINGKNS